MKKLNIVETYKAVLLKNEFEAELKELEELRKRILGKGTINDEKVLKYIIRGIFILSIILLALNLFVRFEFSVILVYPFHLMYATFLLFPIAFTIAIYNKVVRSINKIVLKKREDREILYYEQNKKAVKTNLKTINNALKEQSKIPPKYHYKEVLEVAIQYLKEGKAINEKHALSLFEKEFPDFFGKGTLVGAK